jgi:enoyl-CoA hydratase/carnithine racemase
VGWPIGKELLFSARVVEAEEAYRIGLLNYLVPREQLRAKTMELSLSSRGVLVKSGDAGTVVMPYWSRCAIAPPLLIGRSEASAGRRDGAGD